jgi:nitrous oxidase accessory protein
MTGNMPHANAHRTVIALMFCLLSGGAARAPPKKKYQPVNAHGDHQKRRPARE